MQSKTRLVRAGLLLASWLLLSAAGTTHILDATKQDGVVLSMSLTQRTTLREPVVFTYLVANNSKEGAWVSAGNSHLGAFEFDVGSPTGVRHTGRYEHRDGGMEVDPFEVPAGQTYSQSLAIGEWFDFSEVGTYVVSVTFRGTVFRNREALRARAAKALSYTPEGLTLFPEFIASKPETRETRFFTLEVWPRDEARLRAVCERLFDRAQVVGSRDGAQAQQQLGTVRDPVAIPYMEALVRIGRTMAYFSVLREMGTPDARAALERLALHRDPTYAEYARVMLSAFEPIQSVPK